MLFTLNLNILFNTRIIYVDDISLELGRRCQFDIFLSLFSFDEEFILILFVSLELFVLHILHILNIIFYAFLIQKEKNEMINRAKIINDSVC